MTETSTQPPREAERPVIGGKYVLDKMLGQGGYSWVYLAKHKNIQDLNYVVKLLKPTHLGNDQVLRRFEQEANTLARIRSPRIARIVDYGPTENGIPYIVSEYIEGVTIGLILRENGAMSPWLTAHLGCQMLEGLEDAHKAGVIHRDLKPDNVLITREGEDPFPSAMILDFGIAKVTQEASDDADATVEGLACSPRYAAPEVLTREPSYKSDLYAMGLVLAEMLLGHPVYRGKHNLILASEQLSSEKVPLPDEVLTGPLGSIIARACEKDQDKRYEDATAMLEELREMRQTLMPFSEAAKTEIDLPQLIAVRNDGPDEGADTTSLTENFHTFEMNTSGSGTVSVDIGELVAGKRATKMNRVLVPLLIAHVIAVFIAGIAVYFYLQNNAGDDTAAAERERASTDTLSGAPPVNVAAAMRNAGVRVHNALGLSSGNNITLTTDIDDATLWLRDEQIGKLPVKNLVTDNARPLVLGVRADGYEPVELQITQTGRVSLRVGLDKLEPEEASAPAARRSRPRVVRDTPTPRSSSPPSSSSSSKPSSSSPRRSGDYFDNPF